MKPLLAANVENIDHLTYPLIASPKLDESFDIGVKDKPRFPVWLGMRDKEDL